MKSDIDVCNTMKKPDIQDAQSVLSQKLNRLYCKYQVTDLSVTLPYV